MKLPLLISSEKNPDAIADLAGAHPPAWMFFLWNTYSTQPRSRVEDRVFRQEVWIISKYPQRTPGKSWTMRVSRIPFILILQKWQDLYTREGADEAKRILQHPLQKPIRFVNELFASRLSSEKVCLITFCTWHEHAKQDWTHCCVLWCTIKICILNSEHIQKLNYAWKP